jgi:hypothetical protein
MAQLNPGPAVAPICKPPKATRADNQRLDHQSRPYVGMFRHTLARKASLFLGEHGDCRFKPKPKLRSQAILSGAGECSAICVVRKAVDLGRGT